MAQADSRPRIGEGRIGGFLCAAIGLLSVAAVLCLRYPAFLTTPELRVHYDVELLRLVLAVGGMLGQFLHPFVGPVQEFLEHRSREDASSAVASMRMAASAH